MKIRISHLIWTALFAMAFFIIGAALGHLNFSSEVILAYGLLISCYVGGDQLGGVLKTKSMPPGQKFTGNRKKLLYISIATLALTILAKIMDFIYESDIPVAGLFSIYLSCTALLAAGEKGKNAFKGETKKEKNYG